MYILSYNIPYKDLDMAMEKLQIHNIYNVFYESPLEITTDDYGYGYIEKDDEDITLKVAMDDTEGELNTINFCTYACVECGEEVNVYEDDDMPNDWVYSNYYDGYLCPNCSRYVEFLDDYYSAMEEFVTVHIKENYDEDLPLCYVKQNPLDYVKIDNEWYNLYHEAVQFDDESDEYIIVKD